MIKHFLATPDAIDQPPLNAHVVAMHLGGPKRVHRRQGKRVCIHDVIAGAMTLMPAYQANAWQTEGPIEFAHLTLSIGMLEQITVEEFDREPATQQLHDTVGLVDPLLEHVFLALLCRSHRRLHHDALLTVFAVTLLERHSTLSEPRGGAASRGAPRRGGLAGWQLRRVIDTMHAHMHEDLALSSLAKLTGLSRSHFFRAFRQSTGRSPGQFLSEIRLRKATVLLKSTALPIEEISSALGFLHARHFSTAFIKRVGVSPKTFRVR